MKNETFGGRLRQVREERGMSQNELRKRCGIQYSGIISYYESGKSSPRNERLCLIASILGVSPSWLLFGAGEKNV